MKETIRFEGNGFKGAYIIARAEQVNLDTRVLYEAVIDLASEGLFTANCINMAAGILLEDLGLPKYFFENISINSISLSKVGMGING